MILSSHLLFSHLVWGIAALALFWLAPARYAFWAIVIGGWLLLPPADYGPVVPGGPLPYWIVGSGLPGGLLVTKMWTAPAIALLASLLFDAVRWRRLEWHLLDAPVAVFCLWPLAQALFVPAPDPAPPIAALYLAGAWGLPWLAGRLYLSGRDDAHAFAGVLAIATLLCLPLAILEGITPFRVHRPLYGDNPFALDGIQRYIGYRPQLFFEHGNQYGLWCAGAALAAAWLWREAEHRPAARGWRGGALVLLALTLASQSVGAILLLLLCLLLLLVPRIFAMFRLAIPFAFAAMLAIGALHVSGMVPMRSLVMETHAGQAALGALRATGRGSAAWRVSQDLKTLPLLRGTLATGTGKWDWFKPARSRPWGLPLLILGQFGLVGLLAAAVLTGAAILRHAARAAEGNGRARLFALLVLLFAVDALLNSFLFYPALAAAAARTGRGEQGRRGSDVNRTAAISREPPSSSRPPV